MEGVRHTMTKQQVVGSVCCNCGHLRDDHFVGRGKCAVLPCDCSRYCGSKKWRDTRSTVKHVCTCGHAIMDHVDHRGRCRVVCIAGECECVKFTQRPRGRPPGKTLMQLLKEGKL